MTPAERESAVAFALRNCRLDGIDPSGKAMEAAAGYTSGAIAASRLPTLLAPGAQKPSGEAGRDRERGASSESGKDRYADAVFAGTILSCERGWRPSGDLGELQAIHASVFAFTGAGAGRIRSDQEEGPDAQGDDAFFPAALLQQGAAAIGSGLAEEGNLANLDFPAFIDRLTYYYDELGYLHPFPSGNAMTLRMFASRLSHDAGWDLDWALVDRAGYEKATRAAYLGDAGLLKRMLWGIARPANPTRIFLVAGWEQGPAH